MKPGAYDLDIYRGDTYRWSILVWADEGQTQPVDLTGATAKAEVREAPGGAQITVLTTTITPPNTIDMSLTPAMYATIPDSGVWDLQVTFPDTDVRTVLAGKVTVTPDVTDSTGALALRAVRRSA